MKIKLMLSPGEISEIQQHSKVNFQSPTAWCSQVIARHLDELRKALHENSEGTREIWAKARPAHLDAPPPPGYSTKP